MPISICVFDAYGTLFDVEAAARRAAQEPEHAILKKVWPSLAADWRSKQLQYTWLRQITGEYVDFWQVTCDGLDWAMERAGLEAETKLRSRLLALYRALEAYSEVPEMLKALKRHDKTCAILSNGAPDMLDCAVSHAGIGEDLDAVLSVDAIGAFKPDARVYQLVLDRFACAQDEVLFVSSNGWDVSGAAGFGFRTVWVNRTGVPVDRLPATPHHILSDLTEIPNLAESF